MPKKKPGPKRKPLDLQQIEGLARAQCSDREIAAVLDIPQSTFADRVLKDDELRSVLEKARLAGAARLRVKQYELAMKGDKTMLVWLGKNVLAQADKAESKLEGSMNITTWDDIVKASKGDA